MPHASFHAYIGAGCYIKLVDDNSPELHLYTRTACRYHDPDKNASNTFNGSFASLPERLSILFCVRDSKETSSPSLNFLLRVLRFTVMYLGKPALMPAHVQVHFMHDA